MNAFLSGVVVAILLAVAGAVVLQDYVDRPSTQAFTTSGARPS